MRMCHNQKSAQRKSVTDEVKTSSKKNWSKETAESIGKLVRKKVAEKISKATLKITRKDDPSKSTGPVQIIETRIQLIEILKEKSIPPVKGL